VHKAIGQSGAFFPSPTRGMMEKTLADKEKDGAAFAASVGAASLAELRAKPAADLLAAVMSQNGGWGYSPGVDGYFMPERASALYARGLQAKVPLLAGWTSSEIGMAVAMNPQKPTVASFTEEARKTFGEKASDAVRAYGATSDEAASPAAAALASDLFIAYSTWKWMEVHAASAPVFRYRFDRALPAPNGMNRFGAVHASDIEYSFHTLDSKPEPWTPDDRSAEATFSAALANFVRAGTPVGPGVPEWPDYGKTHRVMTIDAKSAHASEADRARYELIDAVAPK
jgi:para-nitrobenzyl esterase